MLPALSTRASRLVAPEGTVLQCILGSLLGDACLDMRATFPRISMVHGQPQEEYARYKAHILRDYVRTARGRDHQDTQHEYAGEQSHAL